MMITNKLKLDLQKPGTIPTINAVQNDSYSRNLEIALYADRQPFIFPETGRVVIRYKKSDGKGGEYDTLPDGRRAWQAERNILTIALAPQVLTTPGSVSVTVTLIDGDTQLSVFPIRLAVEPIAAAKQAASEDYFYITGLLPAPVSGTVGQSLRISAINSEGRITAVEAADKVAPQKGIDYWTNEDKESIIQDILTELDMSTFDPTVYGLPVLYLTGDTTGMSKENAVTLDYAYGERSGKCTLKWQGSSSLAYPKKNYTIKFDNAFEAAEGWGAQKKYCLKANFVDHSHARNIVSAKLWGEIVKSRIYTPITPISLFDINNVTGAVYATDGTDKSNTISITDSVITATLSAVDAGGLFFAGNTFPAGRYTVTLEVYNPNDSTTDNHKQFRFIYGKVGPYGTAYTYDLVSAPFGEWTTVTKEIEFTEDGSMVGFIGNSGRNYQFRNIRVVPKAENDVSGTYINNVTGAVYATNGTDKSNTISITDSVITATLSAVDAGGLFFTGNTFPAGRHTVTLEVYNPNDSTTDNHEQFRFIYGKVGPYGTAYTYDLVSAPFGEWTTVTKEIEFAEDGSMIGFIGHSGRNYQFRNIRVVPAESVETDTLDHSNLQNLVNGGAIDGFPVCVYINGQYTGLYTFNIPKDGWMFGMGNGVKECILCANNHSAATRFEAAALCDKSDFEIEYITDEANTAWAVESVNMLISAVMNSNGTNFNTLAKYLDLQSAIDFYIFTALQTGVDNVDKNYILATYDGVKWFFSTYDMDGTFGNHWAGTKYYSANSYPTLLDFNNKMMRLLRDHKAADVKARYHQLRDTILSEHNVLLQFQNFMASIPAALYEQDTKLWPSIPGTKTNNIAQIANNYRLRVQLLDAQIEEI